MPIHLDKLKPQPRSSDQYFRNDGHGHPAEPHFARAIAKPPNVGSRKVFPLKASHGDSPRPSSSPCVSVSDDIHDFENAKTKALKQVRDLQHENEQLSMKTKTMLKRIEVFSILLKTSKKEVCTRRSLGQFGNGENPHPRQIPMSAPSTPRMGPAANNKAEIECLTSMTGELKNLQTTCSHNDSKLLNLIRQFQGLMTHDSKVKEEIASMQWQLQQSEKNSKELRKQLNGMTKMIDKLTMENQTLISEKRELEEQLWSTKIELVDLSKENESQGYFSPLQRLEQMKKAFDDNENVIENQKKQLEEKNALIQKYHQYCEMAHKILEEKAKHPPECSKNNDEKYKKLKKANYKNQKLRMEAEQEAAQLHNELLLVSEENESLKHSLATYVRQVDKVEVMNYSLINRMPVQSMPFESDVESNFTTTTGEFKEIFNQQTSSRNPTTKEVSDGSGDAAVSRPDPLFGPPAGLRQEMNEVPVSKLPQFDNPKLRALMAELSNVAETAKNLGSVTDKILTVFEADCLSISELENLHLI